jgi:hypothetical protein
MTNEESASIKNFIAAARCPVKGGGFRRAGDLLRR